MSSKNGARPVFGEPLEAGQELQLSDDEKEFRDLAARIKRTRLQENPGRAAASAIRVVLPSERTMGPFRPLLQLPAPDKDDLGDEAENWRWVKEQWVNYGQPPRMWNESSEHFLFIKKIRTHWKWESIDFQKWSREAFASMLGDNPSPISPVPVPRIAPPADGEKFAIIPVPPAMESYGLWPTTETL